MIPYAELVDALERYRRRMGFAPSGSSLGGGAQVAPAPQAPAPPQQVWQDDATNVNAGAGQTGYGDEDMGPLADPPVMPARDPGTGPVDIGDLDVVDEEPL
jgi:hypothetical protein